MVTVEEGNSVFVVEPPFRRTESCCASMGRGLEPQALSASRRIPSAEPQGLHPSIRHPPPNFMPHRLGLPKQKKAKEHAVIPTRRCCRGAKARLQISYTASCIKSQEAQNLKRMVVSRLGLISQGSVSSTTRGIFIPKSRSERCPFLGDLKSRATETRRHRRITSEGRFVG